MEINVYNWEKKERWRRRYVIFALVLIIVIGLSLRKNNIIGVIVLFFILWAYFYYNSVGNQLIKIRLETNHLTINKKIYSREFFKWYSLEIEKKSQELKNLILIHEKWILIYTFEDSKEQIKNFLIEINNNLPLTSQYEQWSLEKLARILKL